MNILAFEYTDEETGQKISLSASPYYSILKIDSREYYFVRETGEFDGTGECAIKGPTLVFDSKRMGTAENSTLTPT